jgi:hypothetical protein
VRQAEYVQLLMQYRLRDACREQTEEFIKGLTEIVPDEILGAFDEADLDVCVHACDNTVHNVCRC